MKKSLTIILTLLMVFGVFVCPLNGPSALNVVKAEESQQPSATADPQSNSMVTVTKTTVEQSSVQSVHTKHTAVEHLDGKMNEDHLDYEMVETCLQCGLELSRKPADYLATTAVAEGQCGDAAYWKLDKYGTLTVFGSGEMESYEGTTNFGEISQSPWSEYSESVKKVVIDYGITEVGTCAFAYYPNLTTVTFADSVIYLDNFCFYWCQNLVNYSLPVNLQVIADGAFDGTGVKELTVPGTIRWLGKAFDNCRQLEKVTFEKEVTIEDDSYGGLTTLAPMFSNCSSIKEFVCETGAFFTTYKNVVLFLHDDILNRTEIARVAPQSAIKTIDLVQVAKTNPFEAYTPWAFLECNNLTVNFSNAQEYIRLVADSWFYDVYGEFNYAHGLGWNCKITFNGKTPSGKIVIPDDIEHINYSLFDGFKGIEEVVIGKNVKTIGDCAFFDCEKLAKITFNTNVECIGDNAFTGCNSLAKVSIPSSVKTIANSAFGRCESLAVVEIPKSVTEIFYDIFRGCEQLRTVITSKGSTADEYMKSKYPNVKIVYNDLSAPTIESVTAVEGGLKVSWTKEDNATKYYVYRRAVDESEYSYIGSTKYLTYTDSTVSVGTKYYYKICSVLSVEGLTYKSAKSTAKSGNALAKPVPMTITYSDGAFDISWGKAANAQKYYVYRSVNGGEYVYLKSTKYLHTTDSDIEAGSYYSYKICSVASVDGKTLKSSKSTNIDAVIPVKPHSPSVSKASTGVKVCWSSVEYATKYYVYRSVDGGSYTYLQSTTSLSTTDTKVEKGHTYRYKIVAIAMMNNQNYKSEKSAASSKVSY